MDMREIVNNYEQAAELFNEQYENEYKYCVKTFIDFETFNIYFYDLNKNVYYPIKVLNHLIPELSINECFKMYESFFFNERSAESFSITT